jgi:hypothetical protein
MKLLDYIFVALLATTAYLQLNDPDPIYWVLVYGLGAVVALLNALGNRSPLLAALTIGMVISGMIYAAPGMAEFLQAGDYGSITGSMDGPARYVEPAREFIGLLLELLLLAYYAWRWRSA